jgi:hypothetical protein
VTTKSDATEGGRHAVLKREVFKRVGGLLEHLQDLLAPPALLGDLLPLLQNLIEQVFPARGARTEDRIGASSC